MPVWTSSLLFFQGVMTAPWRLSQNEGYEDMCSEETIPAGTELIRGHGFGKIRGLNVDCPQQAWLSCT